MSPSAERHVHAAAVARAARRKAHALLEKAKQVVEMTIELNEATGMAALKG